jgi:hypothetical protein
VSISEADKTPGNVLVNHHALEHINPHDPLSLDAISVNYLVLIGALHGRSQRVYRLTV